MRAFDRAARAHLVFRVKDSFMHSLNFSSCREEVYDYDFRRFELAGLL
jgi:hypothetical protein